MKAARTGSIVFAGILAGFFCAGPAGAAQEGRMAPLYNQQPAHAPAADDALPPDAAADPAMHEYAFPETAVKRPVIAPRAPVPPKAPSAPTVASPSMRGGAKPPPLPLLAGSAPEMPSLEDMMPSREEEVPHMKYSTVTPPPAYKDPSAVPPPAARGAMPLPAAPAAVPALSARQKETLSIGKLLSLARGAADANGKQADEAADDDADTNAKDDASVASPPEAEAPAVKTQTAPSSYSRRPAAPRRLYDVR